MTAHIDFVSFSAKTFLKFLSATFFIPGCFGWDQLFPVKNVIEYVHSQALLSIHLILARPVRRYINVFWPIFGMIILLYIRM